MGEIAEMMLDGTLCEACGCYIDGEGDGIPRYCSPQCAAGRGAGPTPKKERRIRKEPRYDWSDVLTQMQTFAAENGLTVTPLNPGHPHYQIAKLKGEGVLLVVYPHTTKSTGNQHARIRNEGSTNRDRARELIIKSGLTIKNGSLP